MTCIFPYIAVQYRQSKFCHNFRCRDKPCEGDDDEHVTKDITELMNDSKEAYTTWQQGSKLKLTAMTTQVSIYNNSIERLHDCGAFWYPHMTGFFFLGAESLSDFDNWIPCNLLKSKCKHIILHRKNTRSMIIKYCNRSIML